MSIFQRINDACGRLARSLGGGEGTEGTESGFTPAVRHMGAAERQEFPEEEWTHEQEEREEEE